MEYFRIDFVNEFRRNFINATTKKGQKMAEKEKKSIKKLKIFVVLTEELRDGRKFVGYTYVAKKVGCSRSLVKYWVDVWIKEGKLRVVDGELELVR